MASFLDGELATELNDAMGDDLQSGSLRRETPGGLDSHGDPTSPTYTTYSFKGYRDSFSATFKAQAGIPATDYEIGMLAKSFKDSLDASVSIEPKQGDQILLNSQWSKVRAILEIDPATALYRAQCYEIPDPTA